MDDPAWFEIIKTQAESNEVKVILIQEAVGLEMNGIKASIFVLSDDAARIKTSYPRIGYKEMLDSIFESDTVVTW